MTQFGFEKLVAYQVARETLAMVTRFEVRGGLGDQMKRAARSVVLNVAEGAGRSGGKDKARAFAIARGEAMECAAALDVASVEGLVAEVPAARARALLLREVGLLTGLIRRWAA